MSLDFSLLVLLADELNHELSYARVLKIQQPERDLILLQLRKNKEALSADRNVRLLIRIAGGSSRVHLTEREFENPKEPPMFCMLLRKHLNDAIVQDIQLLGEDRILQIHFSTRNDLGDPKEKYLIVELTGRTANVILCDQDRIILDCLHRIPISEKAHRALLPGLFYEGPERPENSKQGNSNDLCFDSETWGSCSRYLDLLFRDKEQKELQNRHAQNLLKPVRRLRDRQEKKLGLQRSELEQTSAMEQVRQRAELLTANLYRVKKGDGTLTCENYFEKDGSAVTIQIDPLKTPQQNAAKLYKDYRKMKGAKEHLSVLIQEGELRLDYLNSVLDELDRAESEEDLHEIEQELVLAGILKESSRNGKRKKSQDLESFLVFETKEGLPVLVGKNNIQNDILTFRTARRTDYWFHAKNLHGSHVVLQCEGREPSEDSVYYAACLAARFSEAHASGKTAVDYTMVRNVKKPSGAMPGRVIYQNYRTVIADPTDDSFFKDSRG